MRHVAKDVRDGTENVRHGAKNVLHGVENVPKNVPHGAEKNLRHGAKNVRYGAKNVQHAAKMRGMVPKMWPPFFLWIMDQDLNIFFQLLVGQFQNFRPSKWGKFDFKSICKHHKSL